MLGVLVFRRCKNMCCKYCKVMLKKKKVILKCNSTKSWSTKRENVDGLKCCTLVFMPLGSVFCACCVGPVWGCCGLRINFISLIHSGVERFTTLIQSHQRAVDAHLIHLLSADQILNWISNPHKLKVKSKWLQYTECMHWIRICEWERLPCVTLCVRLMMRHPYCLQRDMY